MTRLRQTFAVVLILIGLAALVGFVRFKEMFLFLSPDRDVSPYLWQLLRICLVSFGLVGVTLLLWNHLLAAASRLDRYLLDSDRRTLLIRVVALSFALRALVVWLMPFNLWSDFKCYDELAWQWATDGGYYSGSHLTAYWPPGYPFWLSRLYLVFGHAPLAGAVANVFLGTVTVLLSYALIRHFWGERIGRWTLLIMAVFPSQIFFTNILASEMLFTPLFLGATLLLARGSRSNRWQFTVMIGGIVLGLATLTRTITALYLIPVVAYWAVVIHRFRPVVARFLLGFLGFALVVTPWVVRNQNAVGSYCLSTNSGVNLYIGNQPSSGMGYNQSAATQFGLGNPSKEAAIDSAALAQAREYIKEKPLAFVGRGLLKVGFLYATDLDPLEFELSATAATGGNSWWLFPAVLVQLFWLIELLLATAGIWIVLRSRVHRDGGTWLVLLTLAYWTGVHFLFFSVGRFHFPLVPLISALAAVFLAFRIDLSPTSQISRSAGTK